MTKILIVEDDYALAKSLSSYLEKRDFTVYIATDSSEAAKFLDRKVELIILDILLPGNLNGLDVLEMFKKSEKANNTTPVLVLTNQGNSSIEKTALDRGADYFLVKSNTSLEKILNTISLVTGRAVQESAVFSKIFLTSKACLVMDKIVKQLEKPVSETKMLFIPTASNPYKNKEWLWQDKEKLSDLGFIIKQLDLESVQRNNLKEMCEEADILFMAGGDIFFLMQKIISSGLLEIINSNVFNNCAFIGSSAGSIVTGPDLEPYQIFYSDNKANTENYAGLSLVNFLVLVHNNNPKYQICNDKIMDSYSKKYKIYSLDDEQFISIQGDKIEIC